MKLTVERLAAALSAEFERDHWGDVEPHLFKMVAEGIDPEDDDAEDAEDLKSVLSRVVKTLEEA